jgi:hypothetical protein
LLLSVALGCMRKMRKPISTACCWTPPVFTECYPLTKDTALQGFTATDRSSQHHKFFRPYLSFPTCFRFFSLLIRSSW